jgi:hypothetical protein
MKDGKRVLDENGFWKNELLLPSRSNHVTELYDRLGLAGQLHNVSGATVAEALLSERGLPTEFCGRVAEAIRAHLKADENSSVEGRSLYDADTIDANIGLPAFYRNIQISMHFQERQFAQRNADLSEYLRDSLEEYLNPYIREKIPAWILGKHNDFVAKMTTEAGRQVALKRIARLSEIISEAAAELDSFHISTQTGSLAIVTHFMTSRRNPELSRELAYLSNGWQQERPRTPGAAKLVELLKAEAAGEC